MNSTIIYMRNVVSNPLHRALTQPLPYLKYDNTMGEIETGFEWDGSSVPFFLQGIFPRHRHPVASCRHDKRCREAKNRSQRKFADRQFEIDVGKTSWYVTKKLGYFGVRIGAFFGIGCRYEKENKE